MICSNVSVTFRFFMIFPLDESRKLLGTEERMLVKFWHESIVACMDMAKGCSDLFL